jgi:hypothetical protein
VAERQKEGSEQVLVYRCKAHAFRPHGPVDLSVIFARGEFIQTNQEKKKFVTVIELKRLGVSLLQSHGRMT